MATSVVSIWNDALVEMGSKANVEDEAEGSTQSEAMAQVYDDIRDKLLEELDWPFATGVVSPSPLVTADNPHPNWLYWYKHPADCIKVREVLGLSLRPNAPTPFEVMDDVNQDTVILTDQEGACIEYTRRITDTRKFSPGFTRALMYRLAGATAMKLTSKRAVKDDMDKKADSAFSAAAASIPGKVAPEEDAEQIAMRQ